MSSSAHSQTPKSITQENELISK